ncbi:MAG: molybdenum cofactor biosynthesis protein MoaE, partial [Marinomonas sp.]
MRDIRIENGAFNPHAIASDLAGNCPEAGGIASFLGAVRAGGGVEALELSHYEPLTLAGMEALADDAFGRFDLMG